MLVFSGLFECKAHTFQYILHFSFIWLYVTASSGCYSFSRFFLILRSLDACAPLAMWLHFAFCKRTYISSSSHCLQYFFVVSVLSCFIQIVCYTYTIFQMYIENERRKPTKAATTKFFLHSKQIISECKLDFLPLITSRKKINSKRCFFQFDKINSHSCFVILTIIIRSS